MIGKRNLYLIGSMGSGKTAVGRQLARLLNVPFYDSDAEVVRRAGVDIPYIFEQEGEAGFREREREAIEAITQLEPIVLATGGGAILMAENRTRLIDSGTVIRITSGSRMLSNCAIRPSFGWVGSKPVASYLPVRLPKPSGL